MTIAPPEAPAPLAQFVRRLRGLAGAGNTQMLAEAAEAMRALVAADEWLPAAYARPDPLRYTQYLLHLDPEARFSVVSFVWGPGQATPIHDHGTWAVVGVLRGVEASQRFAVGSGPPRSLGPPEQLPAGSVETLSPAGGDVHRVANALPDGISVSIHAYGADIGRQLRHTFPPEGGARAFVSGYANDAATPAFEVAP